MKEITIEVLIEIPKGSRNNYEFDKERQMIPMNEFVKIPPQTKNDFIKSEFAHYLQ